MTARNWSSALERALLAAVTVLVVLKAVSLVSALARVSVPTVFLALSVVLAMQVVVLLCCGTAFVRGIRSVPAFLPITAALVGLVCSAAAVGMSDGDLSLAQHQVLPMNALAVVQFLLLLFLSSGRSAVVALLLMGPVYLALRLSSSPTGYWPPFEEWLLASCGPIALAALLPLLRESARVGDASAAAAQAAIARRTAREAEDRAASDAHRIIHDDVITALRGIELRADQELVAAACRRALSSLAGDVTRAPADLLSRIAESSPVPAVVDGRWEAVLPPDVEEAFVGAAGEALRNVARHSGADHARLAAREVDDVVVLEICDDGRGMGASAPGFGIASSIVARIEEAGGWAEISEPARGGTMVRLCWAPRPAQPAAEVDRETPLLAQRRRRAYLLITLPLLAVNLVLAVAHAPSVGWGTALVAGSAGVQMTLLGWRIGRATPRGGEVVAHGVWLCATTATGLALAGPGALLGLESWVVGFCAMNIAIIAFEVRPRDVAVLVGSQCVVIAVAAAVDPTITLVEAEGALAEPVMCGAFTSIIGGMLRGSRRPIEELARLLRDDAVHRAWSRRFATARAENLAEVARRVSPLLHEAAARGSRRDLAREAGELALQCRDDLHFDTPLSHDVHELMSATRDGGVTVSIRVPQEPAHQATTETLMRSVLPPPPGVEHVVVYPACGSRAPRVVLRPGIDGATAAQLRDGPELVSVSHSPERTQVELVQGPRREHEPARM